jgi:cytochrome c553
MKQNLRQENNIHSQGSTIIMKQALTFTSLFLFVFSCHVYAGDVTAGKEKSAICAACHGADGNSVNPVWPKLAGQHPGYIFKQLKDFHSGARKNVQMSPLAAPLNEGDMRDIAAYYSSQKIKIGHASAETLPLGERIYRAGDASKGLPACMACHGPSGAGNSAAAFPAISGQHAEYTKIQLLAFRDNKRTNDINKAMQIVSEKMTTDEIDAVANYIQGLH